MTEELRAIIVLEGKNLASAIGVQKAVENNPYTSDSDESEAYISGCMMQQAESDRVIATVIDVAIAVVVVVLSILMFRYVK